MPALCFFFSRRVRLNELVSQYTPATSPPGNWLSSLQKGAASLWRGGLYSQLCFAAGQATAVALKEQLRAQSWQGSYVRHLPMEETSKKTFFASCFRKDLWARNDRKVLPSRWLSVTVPQITWILGCTHACPCVILLAFRLYVLSGKSTGNRIIECFGMEGSFSGHLAQPHCSEQGQLQVD